MLSWLIAIIIAVPAFLPVTEQKSVRLFGSSTETIDSSEDTQCSFTFLVRAGEIIALIPLDSPIAKSICFGFKVIPVVVPITVMWQVTDFSTPPIVCVATKSTSPSFSPFTTTLVESNGSQEIIPSSDTSHFTGTLGLVLKISRSIVVPTGMVASSRFMEMVSMTWMIKLNTSFAFSASSQDSYLEGS